MSTTPKRPSQEIAARIAALQKDYQATARAEFAAGFKDLFVAHPRLKSVAWSASNEYNDEGGSDYLSQHEDPTINGFSEYDEDSEDETPGENLYAENAAVGAKSIVKAVKAFLRDFPEGFYEEQFGLDTVSVTAEGISTD